MGYTKNSRRMLKKKSEGKKPKRKLVFEQEGDVTRYFIQADDTCKQSRYDSAVALGYVPGTCAEHGYPNRHTNMGMTWYTKNSRRMLKKKSKGKKPKRKLVFEQEGDVTRYFIQADDTCKQS